MSYIEKNYSALLENEKTLTKELMIGLSGIKGVRLLGAGIDEERTNVISVQTDGIDEAYVSALLLEREGIETRVGLHCAPQAHISIGSFPRGSLRFSPGPFTTKDEIMQTISAMKEIMKNA